MEIELNVGKETVLLRGTQHCYELCHQRMQKGKTVWTPEKYYSTLSGAMQSLLELKIRNSDANNLVELYAVIKEAHEELSSPFSKLQIKEDTEG